MNLHDPDYYPQWHGRGVRPLPGRCGAAAVQTLRAVHALDATRCHGIFGSGDKTQSTNNTQIGASEDAVLGYNSTLTSGKDDAVTLGGYQSKNTLGSDLSAGNAIQNDGGISLGGYGNRNVLGGVELGGNNSGSITINGAAGAEALADKFTDAVKGINSNAGQSVTSALEKVTTLAESKLTGGASTLGRQVLWGLGIVASGGVILYIANKFAASK